MILDREKCEKVNLNTILYKFVFRDHISTLILNQHRQKLGNVNNCRNK